MEVEPLGNEKEEWEKERIRVLDEWSEIELKGAEALKVDVTHEPGSPTEAMAVETSLQDLYPLLAGPASPGPLQEPLDDVAIVEQAPPPESIDNRSIMDRLLDVCLCRPIKSQMSPLSYTHKCLILKLAQLQYDNSNGTHWLLLSDYFQNVQRALDPKLDPGAHVAAPSRVGPHWVTVGFQGPTPETDFRGCGVLALLQMHTFTQRIPSNLFRAMVTLATTEPNDFPLAVVSINITSIILTQLKKGALDSFGTETEGLYPFFSALHAASMAKFCAMYKSQNCTLAQTQSLFSEITRQLEKSPLPLLLLLNANNDELITSLL